MGNCVGIISLYYKNYNYGGLLQSYAMVRALKNIGYNAVQISYDRYSEPKKSFNKDEINSHSNLMDFINKYLIVKGPNYLFRVTHPSDVDYSLRSINLRNKILSEFEKSIPHSRIYSHLDIGQANDEFDYFICGSDQIWNPSYLRDAYFLDFVSEEKKKIAYAASIGRSHLSSSEYEYINKKTRGFSAISVREASAFALLKSNGCRNMQVVLDPTLLLSLEEWETLEKTFPISKDYVFAYYLDDSVKQRKLVQDFAKKRNLILVTFPNLLGKYRKEDYKFGDVQVYDATPGQFLYLIKNASFVFTDSFHVCMFSILYKKNFIVFERGNKVNKNDMNSRVRSLLEIFGLEEQFVNEDEFKLELDCLHPNYLNESSSFADAKKMSYNYLINSLRGE